MLVVTVFAAAALAVLDPALVDPYQANTSHYYPDCWPNDRGGDGLVCAQRPAAAGAIRVGCVGDSITAVGHTSSKAHQYPSQLCVPERV